MLLFYIELGEHRLGVRPHLQVGVGGDFHKQILMFIYLPIYIIYTLQIAIC